MAKKKYQHIKAIPLGIDKKWLLGKVVSRVETKDEIIVNIALTEKGKKYFL